MECNVEQEGLLSRMALNDNKAGMEGLDRDKINKIILETSKGSRFYENELKKEQQVNQRIERMMQHKAKITEQQIEKAQTEVEKLSAELERSRDLGRVIVHVDMDAFYAAVEMRDCPELKDKPMAVGSTSMLSTSNYHARRFGVRAAMPGFIAKKLCPNLVIVPPNFDKYKAVSQEVRDVFADYDPNFLPMSLDEAYLDITEHMEQRQHWPESMRTHLVCDANPGGDMDKARPEAGADTDNLSPVLFEDSPSASPTVLGANMKVEVFGTTPEEAVREMRFRIEQKTSLTASAGIAPNMMLAKVCSDKNKPNGQYRIPSERQPVMDFIQDLPVRKVSGVGKVTEKMLAALGIVTCAQLRQQMAVLSLLFSETSWHHFLQISLGLGSTRIERDSERKSMSTERTFGEMSDVEEQYSLCKELCHDLAQDLQKESLKGKTVTLKLKNVNFEVKTRAFTLQCAVCTEEEIFAAAKELLKAEIDHVSPQPLRLRLMGVRVSSFISVEDKQPQQRSIVGFLKTPSDSSRSKQPSKVLSKPETASLSSVSAMITESSSSSVVKETTRPHSSKWGAESRDSNCPPQHSFFQMAYSKRLQQQSVPTSVSSSGSGIIIESKDLDTDSTVAHKTATTSNPTDKKETCSSITRDEADQTEITSETSLPKTNLLSPTVSSINKHVLVKPESSNTPCFICPVCFKEMKTVDLTAFNQHIDECLMERAQDSGSTSLDVGQGLFKEEKCKQELDEVEEYLSARPCPKDTDLNSRSRGSPDPSDGMRPCSSSLNTDADMIDFECNGKNFRRPLSERFANTKEIHRSIPGTSRSMKDSESFAVQEPPGCNVVPMKSPNVKASTLVCPVCNQPQNTEDLTLFNHHVDMCLNQEVLLEFRDVVPPQGRSGLQTLPKVTGHEKATSTRGKSKRRGSSPPPPSKKTKAIGVRQTIDKFFK